MLSSRTASTPRGSSSASWASESTSTSIFTRCPTPAFARRTASATPPATAMWLSLIRTASSRPKRWLLPPPAFTACFCSARRPGMVLRVSATLAWVCAIASAMVAVPVATPDRCPRKFSATRSPLSRPRAGPEMVPITVPGWTRLPSGSRSEMTIRGSTSSQARRAQSVPAMTPGSRETSATRAVSSAPMVESLVRSPARPRSSSSAARTSGSITMRGSDLIAQPPPPAPHSPTCQTQGGLRPCVVLLLAVRSSPLVETPSLPALARRRGRRLTTRR